ncbi:uncharacterized protein CANTADRAFT_302624 [Suhomyces tanzawaensis NRRL Y-17324]|uniref:Uncharacterized protein n=1 Tax=Suhomyces tanzawaensis NRRL Y-17324 TaxID=984487 RepID=A0A1E4SCL8_9ASCO|nr:uncharacterized protein CANTADRAFT_302624 [Suhomyces tanzawaensis NRRL Y-17324]ODV77261.1 hypothetical protein CANTADRAFT_302624 [Suhomyces tanzawaensis NRRL Y-17324]
MAAMSLGWLPPQTVCNKMNHPERSVRAMVHEHSRSPFGSPQLSGLLVYKLVVPNGEASKRSAAE